jgi:ATP-dependent DNA helicase DinG
MLGITVQEIFAKNGLLASCFEQYEPRQGQMLMAEAVSKVVMDDEGEEDPGDSKILVVEAETGIGKTIAYLIPAILSGKRMVVSTATLNLQDQIMEKEIPLICRLLQERISAVCVKGRQNYLCRYRWYQYRSSPQLSLLDDAHLAAIDSWIEETATGDRAELTWLAEKSPLWPRISAQSNQCLGSECPESSLCFISQLRKRAGAARLLIVNHHLFFSDLALRQGGFAEVLPRYEGVIFDEAHHLENVATTFFGISFSQYQILDLVTDIERQAELDFDPDSIVRIRATMEGVQHRADQFALLFPAKRGRYVLSEIVSEITETTWRAEVDLVSTGLLRLGELAAEYGTHSDIWKLLEKRVKELNSNLLDIAFSAIGKDKKRFVYWYEKRERTIVLSATPIHIAELLQESLYAMVECCIMTSATLSSGGDFSYLQNRLGLAENTEFLRLPSPFDYPRRTLLYVPEDRFPEPAATEYPQAVCERTLDILRLSRGRALVLFTSFKGMDSMAEYLEKQLDYPVLVQGSASRNALLHSFRENTESVLLAVASFWEGVDIPGDSLSCVVIDKLPFEVPSDPVIQARIAEINEMGGKAFFDFQIPRAVLVLRQGVGRLMRAATDRGVIAVMDVRLFSKAYGRMFLRSMPPSPIVRDLAPLADFFVME